MSSIIDGTREWRQRVAEHFELAKVSQQSGPGMVFPPSPLLRSSPQFPWQQEHFSGQQKPRAVTVQEQQRFRSFAERYVVERTRISTPEKGKELEEAWLAILDAKRLYKQIQLTAEGLTTEDLP